MRKRIVAPTPKDLVLQIAKNEGVDRNDFRTYLQLQSALLPLYDVSTDVERNQFVAVRKKAS